MIEREIDLETPDGAMNTFVVQPDEGGPHPAVLFYMDAPGKREELHDMARRIASVGYFVVLPNLYYRSTREFTMENSEAGMKRMFEMMRTLSNGMVVEDTRALLAFVDAESGAREGKVGAVGYCMSGPFVFAAAAAYPERFAATASIYGAGLVTDRDDSPHRTADRIQGEIYFACAEIDRYAPKEQIDALTEHLAKTDVDHRIEWYPGVEHGFAFPERKGIYDKPAAEQHWERLFSLFARNLGATA
ncbi:MAG: dienelactone hydrolase family protein [Myxococcales bacterium]|nr:dienelactone hydrolase family protein [Myxococcales bacterium]